VDRAARKFGDQVFLRDRSGPLLTFETLREKAEHIGACLQALGLRKGDRAGVMLPNSQHFLTIWVGLLKGGIVEVPVHPANKGMVLQHQLIQAGVCLLFTDADGFARLLALEPVPCLKRVVILGGSDALGPSPYEVIPFQSFLDLGDAFVAPDIDFTDVASVLFTSGTTGPSKGASVSHNHNIHIAATTIDIMGATPSDTLLLSFPLTHAGGRYATSLTALMVGASVYMEKFSASGFWDTVRREGVTGFLYLGGVLPILWKQPERPNDADNPVSRAWGAAAPADLVNPFQDRFGLRLIEIYGTAETGNATFPRPGREKLGSCGEAAEHLDVAIVDENDQPCNAEAVGEIVVRPRQPYTIVNEYVGMPEQTVRAFRNLWFHTGDRGRMDAQGRLYFVDRLKDAIRRRGENISSWEVEQVVLSHPNVVEVAAYAVPSELGEDEVMVAIVRRPNTSLSGADLVSHCSLRMADFSVPRYVRFVESLPRNPSDRVQKYLLRDDAVTADTWDRLAN